MENKNAKKLRSGPVRTEALSAEDETRMRMRMRMRMRRRRQLARILVCTNKNKAKYKPSREAMYARYMEMYRD
jgi:hypothetical protein